MVIPNNGDPADIAVLVAKPLEDLLRGMPLLPRPALILRQDTVDDPGERVELRTRRWSPPPILRPVEHRVEHRAEVAWQGVDDLQYNIRGARRRTVDRRRRAAENTFSRPRRHRLRARHHSRRRAAMPSRPHAAGDFSGAGSARQDR